MNENVKHIVKNHIVQKMKSKRLSANQAATQIGFSSATLSKILNGKWEDIGPTQWNLAKAWSGYRSGWNLAETHNTKHITGICIVAQRSHRAIGLAYEAGSGKSETLKSYTNENPNVFYVECEEFWSKKHFVSKILAALGQETGNTTTIDMIEHIIDILNSLDSPLLIIDEADKLNDSSIQLFKTFYNKCEGQAGFVLAGAPYLAKRIESGCNRNKQAYKEILSRLGGSLQRLSELTSAEIEKIALQNGVSPNDMSGVMALIGRSKDLRHIRRTVEDYIISIKINKKVA